MKYAFLVFVFFSCLVLRVGTAEEIQSDNSQKDVAIVETSANSSSADDEIPLEALKRAPEEPSYTSAKITAKAAPVSSGSRPSLAFQVGGTHYLGGWATNIGNYYSSGLGLEIPFSQSLSGEIEAGYGKYNITYSGLRHDFNQYNLGGNLKWYPIPSTLVRPYVGVGITGLFYEGMQRGPWEKYNQNLGAGQLFVGTDVPVNDTVSFGVRGSWVNPLFNRPLTADNGVVSAPLFEEANAMNTQYFKLMGALKLAL